MESFKKLACFLLISSVVILIVTEATPFGSYDNKFKVDFTSTEDSDQLKIKLNQ